MYRRKNRERSGERHKLEAVCAVGEYVDGGAWCVHCDGRRVWVRVHATVRCVQDRKHWFSIKSNTRAHCRRGCEVAQQVKMARTPVSEIR